MTHPASFLRDLTEGIAALLAPQGFGFRDPAATHPLYPAKLPDASSGGPAHAVALTCVPLTDDPAMAQSETRLSFLMRSAADDITDLWAIEHALKDGLAGHYPITLASGVAVSSLEFRTSGALTQDDQNRWESTADYVVNHGRPTAYRQ